MGKTIRKTYKKQVGKIWRDGRKHSERATIGEKGVRGQVMGDTDGNIGVGYSKVYARGLIQVPDPEDEPENENDPGFFTPSLEGQLTRFVKTTLLENQFVEDFNEKLLNSFAFQTGTVAAAGVSRTYIWLSFDGANYLIDYAVYNNAVFQYYESTQLTYRRFFGDIYIDLATVYTQSDDQIWIYGYDPRFMVTTINTYGKYTWVGDPGVSAYQGPFFYYHGLFTLTKEKWQFKSKARAITEMAYTSLPVSSEVDPAEVDLTNFAVIEGYKAIQFNNLFINIPILTDVAMKATNLLWYRYNNARVRVVVLTQKIERKQAYDQQVIKDINLEGVDVDVNSLLKYDTTYWIYPLVRHVQYKVEGDVIEPTKEELNEYKNYLVSTISQWAGTMDIGVRLDPQRNIKIWQLDMESSDELTVENLYKDDQKRSALGLPDLRSEFWEEMRQRLVEAGWKEFGNKNNPPYVNHWKDKYGNSKSGKEAFEYYKQLDKIKQTTKETVKDELDTPKTYKNYDMTKTMVENIPYETKKLRDQQYD